MTAPAPDRLAGELPAQPPLCELVAQALERLEDGGSVELERWARELPPLRRQAVLARVATLQRFGFAPEEDVGSGALQAIGPYRLLARLGEGGFGVVYLAEQAVPIRRRVAVKLLRSGFESESVLRRFAVERELLARFDHPSIAKVLDAGESEDGRPYLVVEFVPGKPITDHCRQAGLDLDARLALFLAVCEGVQHAHQRGVIHRDLKPSNVLVMERDGESIPKIIDFGLARALRGAQGELAMTREGTLLGTVEYMSPEQAEGDADIDTRADVYALGVLLHELLVDDLPHGRARWRAASLGEQLEMIRTRDPVRPSTLAPSRGLAHRTAGDLDWIVLKALAKDRERRYRTVAELQEDIARHLSHRPVLAGPPSWSYVTRKFARRHRGEVIAALLVLLSLIGALAYGADALRRIENERALAERARIAAEEAGRSEREERERAELLNRFLGGMLVQSNPLVGGTRVALSDVLARADEALARGAVSDEPTRLRLYAMLAASYQGVAMYAEAARAYGHVEELVLRRDGAEALSVLRCRVERAWALARGGHPAEALPILERADRIYREREPESADAYVARGNLAVVLKDVGRAAEAEPLYREVIDGLARHAELEPGRSATMRLNLAILLRETGRLEQALLALQALDAELATLEAEERLVGGDAFLPALCAQQLGSALLAARKHAEALPHLERALAFQTRWLGSEHEQALATRNELAIAAKSAGRLDIARRTYEELLPILRRQLGPQAKGTLAVQNNLAVVLQQMGELDAALAIYEELLPPTRAAFPPPHATLATVLCGYAEALAARGRHAEAEAAYVEGIDCFRKSVGPDHEWTEQRLSALATLYRAQGDEELATRVTAGTWPPR